MKISYREDITTVIELEVMNLCFLKQLKSQDALGGMIHGFIHVDTVNKPN